MDTDVELALCVHRVNKTIIKFQEYATGLYYFDALGTEDNVSGDVIAYSFIATVASNKLHYHWREIESANKARALYQKIGQPSTAQFKHIIAHGLIWNCPVTVDDARQAIMIYGPDIPGFKGKTMQGKGKMVPTFDSILIPLPILDLHRKECYAQMFSLCKDSLSYTLSCRNASLEPFWSWTTKNKRCYRRVYKWPSTCTMIKVSK